MFGEIRIHWYFCLLYFSDTEGTHHPLKSNLLKEKIVSFKVQEKVNYTFCNRIKLYFNDMNQKKKYGKALIMWSWETRLRNLKVKIVSLLRRYRKLKMTGTIFRYRQCFYPKKMA